MGQETSRQACIDKLKDLAKPAQEKHLRTLLADEAHVEKYFQQYGDLGIAVDLTRNKISEEVMRALLDFLKVAKVDEKIQSMKNGGIVNPTEKRMVLHTALRCDSSGSGYDPRIARDVLEVRRQIAEFSEQVRSGEWKGASGKDLKNVICIGIGGSYLGVEFIMEGMKTDPVAVGMAGDRKTHFLANVDPIDILRALSGFDAEETLVIICSKTFTTAETILNAKSVKQWLNSELVKKKKFKEKDVIAKHMVAVSTAIELTSKFGITKTFAFWDWVGGRFSACSAIGLLPLTLQFGPQLVDEFLSGARVVDEHFYSKPLEENLPVWLGALSVWNTSFLGYQCCAILPYCQALHRFTAHIQQLDMESNGKRTMISEGGPPVDLPTGAVYLGEPGTNAQHSFYQLLHQGTTVVPADFIGFAKSQNPVQVEGQPLSNHDELMANFFAQPDALAYGRTREEVTESDPNIAPHKEFPGDRPSSLLLFRGSCTPRAIGKLLALYEHRTAVQGWLWGINSFDQYGVELGKVLAKNIGSQMQDYRKTQSTERVTQKALRTYLEMGELEDD